LNGFLNLLRLKTNKIMTINTSTLNGVARIGIARPEKKNAITAAMYQTMADALAAAQADAAVRAILIHGAPEIFTAGNDLEDFMQRPPAGVDAPVFAFMQALKSAEKPVVAAVAGAAVGIGTTLLLHCDLVYAADNAKFSMPFVSLGLCAEFASSVLVAANTGYVRAAEKLLLGEPFDVTEATEMGLVNRALPPAELLAYAQGRAERFNLLPPDAVRTTKRLMRAGRKQLIDQAMAAEGQEFTRLLASDQAKEAFAAFFEHRKPDFAKFA
jgi:enoyl-CoA hydratase/carnithine racemase